MKKTVGIIGIIFFVVFSTYSCHKDRSSGTTVEINSFVWKAMNLYYLWKDDVPALADSRFKTDVELENYVKNYSDPEAFFESLIYQRDVVDKWSWIVDDYIELEKQFSGVRKTSGAIFKLYYIDNTSPNILGIVRYVLPNSDAANKGMKRGDVFTTANGTTLTDSNYYNLLYNTSSVTLNKCYLEYDANTDNATVVTTAGTVTLNYAEYDENPIHTYSIQNIDGKKIGYLMYNSFVSNYDKDLNNAFSYFKNENITDLVLDLRYNGGGSVQTAIYLSSMITGQFTGQIFTTEKWNSGIQSYLQSSHPDWLVNYFTNKMTDGTPLNMLNLNRLIVITTGSSASASELVINALKPYIDVVTIGTTTHGKYTASITLYDSDDFSRSNVNTKHNWAIQPIVLMEMNKLGEYKPEGFTPTYTITEKNYNLGILGDPTEPMYARALEFITTGKRSFKFDPGIEQRSVPENFGAIDQMYVDKKLPIIK